MAGLRVDGDIKQPHEVIICERVSARGGSIVKSTGDGYFIAFADAEKAVLCARFIPARSIRKCNLATTLAALQRKG